MISASVVINFILVFTINVVMFGTAILWYMQTFNEISCKWGCISRVHKVIGILLGVDIIRMAI